MRTKMALCPTCKKESSKPHAPFCSKRCAQIDLGRWLSGQYSIPAEEVDSADIEELQKAVEEAAQEGKVISGNFRQK